MRYTKLFKLSEDQAYELYNEIMGESNLAKTKKRNALLDS